MDTLKDVVIWQNANKVSKEVQEAVTDSDWKDETALKEQIIEKVAKIPYHIEQGYAENNKDHFIEALNKAKKASQKTRALVYDGFIKNYVTKESFDYLYNELAHLSADIGKFKINLLFPER